MPSITCAKCDATFKSAKPVAAGTKTKCPKCGKSFVVEDAEDGVRQAGIPVPLIVAGVGVVLLLCIVGAGIAVWFVFSKPNPAPERDGLAEHKKKEQTKPRTKGDFYDNLKPGEPLVIDAEKLAKDFQRNPQAVAAGVKGRTVEMTGEVFLVETRKKIRITGLLGKPQELIDKRPLVLFYCNIKPEFQETAVRLSDGQRVKIVSNQVVAKNQLTFNDCSLTELEPSKLTAFTAQAFDLEAQGRVEEFARKHRPGILVSGEILRLFSEPNLDGTRHATFLWMKTVRGGYLTISITSRESGSENDLATLTPGQRAEFRVIPQYTQTGLSLN